MIKLPNSIKMVITDFDGVITDNCVYISNNGDISRKLNFKDIMGLFILKKHGYKIAIISGEQNAAIEMLKDKLQIDEIHQNIRNKLEVLTLILEKYSLAKEDFIYVGDDINDLEALQYAKYPITVPQAVDKVKAVNNIQITSKSCGDGAFREIVDALIG